MWEGSPHMTVQVPGQQQYSRRRRKRLVFTGLAVMFLIGVAAIWIANIGSVLSGVFGIVFTLLSMLIAFLQWHPQPRLEAQMQVGGMAASEQNQQQFYEQIEGVALEVNKRKGALIVYTRKDLRGSTINLSFGFHDDNPKPDLASGILGRKRRGNTVYVAVFSSLEPGNYTVHTDSQQFMTKVSILPRRVEEVDW